MPLKYTSVEGVSLDESRAVLRSATHRGNLGLEEVIRTLDCDAVRGDAVRGDAVLRALAVADYIEPADVRGQLFSGPSRRTVPVWQWKRSANGLV